ncbi:hypothetical protein FGO68_gene5800 [Halteria grandinella]|uniref:Uncharacterized protein n=1 Tax=Halteria grandinella TaxID=5974 RepID=A0A8J8P541_HALGN|nr:hypothetical protein FGO68_gene5800 [Halteria grandinella]
MSERKQQELLELFQRFNDLNPFLIENTQAILELKEKAIENLNGDEYLQYLCRVCQESRKIDQICDLMSINDITDDQIDQEIDFNNCYSLVKFQSTSFIHAIWVEFSTVEEIGKTKIQGLQNKLRLETYRDLQYHQMAMRLDDYGDKFHNIEQSYLVPYRILDQYRKGKYFLVKWKNLDHSHSSWEPAYFIHKHYMHLKYDYLRVLQTQDLINDLTSIGATYRYELMRQRDLNHNLVQFTPYQETPSFLNRANEDLKLHDYQVEGLNWLVDSWFKRTNVILADEMGLGKTVQAISYISYLMNVQQITRPFLIVVPLSTIENWEREFQQWCPEARLLPYTSANKSTLKGKAQSQKNISRLFEFFYDDFSPNSKKSLQGLRIPKFNVLLTSYQILVSDYQHLVSIPWRSIIIDEGQRLKSCETQISRIALTFQAEHRILLSGTPLQNNIGELFNLLEYLDPIKFSAQMREDFSRMFSESILMRRDQKIFDKKEFASQQLPSVNNDQSINTLVQNPESQETKDTCVSQVSPLSEKMQDINQEQNLNVETEMSALERLQALLRPHILRRFKRDVFKHFPKKKEVILRVEMTAKQKLVSKSILEQNFEALSQFEKKNNSGVKISLKAADNILCLLRMTANHPLHLTDLYGTEIFRFKNSNKLVEQISQQKVSSAEDFIKDSGKLQYLDRMLDMMIPKGNRILIFTQFISTLDILQDYFSYKDIKNLRLDGQTENCKRQKLIDLFNAPESEYKVFVLSTKAGGLGINLTTADTIIIFDSDCNPHNDVQALNRAHRIGQKNNVMVYRMVCKNSVEERIIEMAKHKLMLDTMMTHTSKSKNDNQEEQNTLYQILKFGTRKLFEGASEADAQKENFAYVIDEEKFSLLMDRERQFAELIEQEKALAGKDDGVKDYLSGFKVASIERKVVLPVDANQIIEVEEDAKIIGCDEESLSEEEEVNEKDNQVFQRILRGIKEKEKAKLLTEKQKQLEEEKAIQESKGIMTRTKLKEPQIQLIDTCKSIETQVKIQQPVQFNNIIPQLNSYTTEKPLKNGVVYQMTNEYAHLVDGLSNGTQTLHHDQNMYLAQMIGNLQKQVQPVIIQFDQSYQQNNEERLLKINGANPRKVRKEIRQLLLTNEDKNLPNIMHYLKVWGFDTSNMRDFVHALLQFGMKNQNYQKLHKKVLNVCTESGVFNSLYFVQQQVFCDFAKNFFDFHKFVSTGLSKVFLTVPHFLFAHYTARELSERLSTIDILSNFTRKIESFNESSWLTFVAKSTTKEWQPDIDNYILAKLLLKYGYSNLQSISSSPLWVLVSDIKLISPFTHFGTLRQYVKNLTKLSQPQLDSLLALKEVPEERQSRVILYQKIARQPISKLKEFYANNADDIHSVSYNIMSMNEAIEQYLRQQIPCLIGDLVSQLRAQPIQ